MQYPSPFIALFAATAVLSLPLNINMGAYSPALVVGDGAIGFKGAESVNQIMNTLQGAAANTAAATGAKDVVPETAAAGTTTAAGGVTQAGVQDTTPAVVAAAPAGEAVVAQGLPQGMGKNIAARGEELENLVKRLTEEEIEDIEDEEDEEAALVKRLTEEEIEDIEDAEDAEKRDLSAEDIAEIDEETELEDADVEKRELTEEEEDEIDAEIKLEDAEKKVKRDMAGFTAALNFATGALKTSPEVQLGTGEGGSGVGITQKPSGATAAATNGTRAVVEKI